MIRKKKQPDPDEVIRLTNLATRIVPSFTITNISEADLRALRDGYVPTWVIQTADWWLREHPKPSDVPPKTDEVEAQ